eukprot:1751457-Pleurochrysis_carterae.AAC.1
MQRPCKGSTSCVLGQAGVRSGLRGLGQSGKPECSFFFDSWVGVARTCQRVFESGPRKHPLDHMRAAPAQDPPP